MLPFFLYFAAGAVTAFHVYLLVSETGFEFGFNVLELASLLGSAGLVAAAYVSLCRPRVAARMALIAALACWFFYAPGIATIIRSDRRLPSSEFPAAVLPWAAIGLLAFATAYSGVVSFKARGDETPTWLFPRAAQRARRIGVGVFSVLAVIGLSAWFALGAHHSQRPSSRFLISDGYVGWVRIEFSVTGAPAMSGEQNQYVFRIPADGVLRTSSAERYGWGKDEYFYSSERGLQSLPSEGVAGRMIWGKINGEQGGARGTQPYEEFFVGTGQQFKEMAGVKTEQSQ